MPVDLKEINKIVALMEQKQLSHFKLERDGEKIELRRGMDVDEISAMFSRMSAPVAATATPVAPATPAPAAAPAAQSAPEASTEAAPSGETINSPMVGTFYRASGPGEDPFVKVGDAVDADTTVCIIEAMKVMNEIKAEKSGTIKKILLDDASPVQFGEPLFEIG